LLDSPWTFCWTKDRTQHALMPIYLLPAAFFS
jgi:hypothetical protein